MTRWQVSIRILTPPPVSYPPSSSAFHIEIRYFRYSILNDGISIFKWRHFPSCETFCSLRLLCHSLFHTHRHRNSPFPLFHTKFQHRNRSQTKCEHNEHIHIDCELCGSFYITTLFTQHTHFHKLTHREQLVQRKSVGVGFFKRFRIILAIVKSYMRSRFIQLVWQLFSCGSTAVNNTSLYDSLFV